MGEIKDKTGYGNVIQQRRVRAIKVQLECKILQQEAKFKQINYRTLFPHAMYGASSLPKRLPCVYEQNTINIQAVRGLYRDGMQMVNAVVCAQV